MSQHRNIDMYAGATVNSGATLECRIDSPEWVDLLWKWDTVEFAVSVDADVLRELLRQGPEALAVLERFGRTEAAGGEVGQVRIYQNGPTEHAGPGVAWRDREVLR